MQCLMIGLIVVHSPFIHSFQPTKPACAISKPRPAPYTMWLIGILTLSRDTFKDQYQWWRSNSCSEQSIIYCRTNNEHISGIWKYVYLPLRAHGVHHRSQKQWGRVGSLCHQWAPEQWPEYSSSHCQWVVCVRITLFLWSFKNIYSYGCVRQKVEGVQVNILVLWCVWPECVFLFDASFPIQDPESNTAGDNQTHTLSDQKSNHMITSSHHHLHLSHNNKDTATRVQSPSAPPLSSGDHTFISLNSNLRMRFHRWGLFLLLSQQQ